MQAVGENVWHNQVQLFLEMDIISMKNDAVQIDVFINVVGTGVQIGSKVFLGHRTESCHY